MSHTKRVVLFVACCLRLTPRLVGPCPRELYKELGDLGDVAMALKKAQRLLRLPAPLTVRHVFAQLKGIASSKGTGSVGRKKGLCEGLIRSARGPETRFLVRHAPSHAGMRAW